MDLGISGVCYMHRMLNIFFKFYSFSNWAILLSEQHMILCLKYVIPFFELKMYIWTWKHHILRYIINTTFISYTGFGLFQAKHVWSSGFLKGFESVQSLVLANEPGFKWVRPVKFNVVQSSLYLCPIQH